MNGYDVFFAEANSSFKTVKCKICGSDCKVMRNVSGATSFAEAMSGRKHLHDYFYCPNKEKNGIKKLLSYL